METVHLADATEVKMLPEEGVLAHFHLNPKDRFGAVMAALPSVSSEFCAAWEWESIDEEPSPELELEEDDVVLLPFVDFQE